jgi:hypothetical protein
MPSIAVIKSFRVIRDRESLRVLESLETEIERTG